MYDLQITRQFQLAGKNYIHQETLSKNTLLDPVEASIPVSKAGTLTTRTDANTGTITMASGSHGITTGAIVDIYWDGGVQRNVTVGTVSGTSVPFDLGIGDNLPVATTTVYVAVVQSFPVSIDGDAVTAIVAAIDSSRGVIRWYESTTETLCAVIPANGAYQWDARFGGTNPLAGAAIDSIKISIFDSTSARNARAAALGA